jgi:hypothetical protein
MKPGGIVALTTVAVFAAWTTSDLVTKPAGDQITDAGAKHAARCLSSNPMVADIHLCPYDGDVVESTALADPLADMEKTSRRLVIRVHHNEINAAFSSHQPAMTACYELMFNHHGLTGGPTRVHCPGAAS